MYKYFLVFLIGGVHVTKKYIYHQDGLSYMNQISPYRKHKLDKLMSIYEQISPIMPPEDQDLLKVMMVRIRELQNPHPIRRSDVTIWTARGNLYATWYLTDDDGKYIIRPSGWYARRTIRIGKVGEYTPEEAREVARKIYTGEMPMPTRHKPPYLTIRSGIYYIWWNEVMPDGKKRRVYKHVGYTRDMTREEAMAKGKEIYQALFGEEVKGQERKVEVVDYPKLLRRLTERQSALKKVISIMKANIPADENYLLVGVQERLQEVKSEITRIRNALRQWDAAAGASAV